VNFPLSHLCHWIQPTRKFEPSDIGIDPFFSTRQWEESKTRDKKIFSSLFRMHGKSSNRIVCFLLHFLSSPYRQTHGWLGEEGVCVGIHAHSSFPSFGCGYSLALAAPSGENSPMFGLDLAEAHIQCLEPVGTYHSPCNHIDAKSYKYEVYSPWLES